MCGCAGNGSEEGRTAYGGDSRELRSPVGLEIEADGVRTTRMRREVLNGPGGRIAHD
jgi:hypothetical protein